MDVSIIFSIAFFLIVALGALRGFRRAKKKGLKRTLTRFVIIVLSAVISIFAAKAIASKISAALFDALSNGTLPEQINDIFNDLPSAPAIILALVSMIISLVLFYPVNSIVTLILRLLSPLGVMAVEAIIDLVRGAFAKKKSKSDAVAAETADASNGTNDEIAPDAVASGEAPDAENVSDITDGPSEDSSDVKKQKKKKKTAGKKERVGTNLSEPFNIGFGILAGVLSVFIFFAPILAGLSIIGMVEDVASGTEAADIEELAPAMEYVHGFTHNAAISVSNAIGGKLMFNALTTFTVNGEKITLYNEAELMCGVAEVALGVYDEGKSPEEKADALDGIMPLFDRSSVIPIIVSEFLSGASKAWEKGETFCGISNPVGEANPMSNAIVDAVALFKDSTPETVREDVSTVIKLASILVKNDVIGNMPENPMDLLKNRTLVSDLFFEIFENARLKVLVNSLVNTGIDMITAALNVPETLDGAYDAFLAELKAASSTDEASLAASFDAVFKRYGIDITGDAVADFTSTAVTTYGLNLSSLSSSELQALLASIDVNKNGTVYTASLSTLSGFRDVTLLVTTEYIESAHGTATNDLRAEANALADVFASLSDVTGLFSGENTGVTSTIKSLGGILDKLAACGTIGRDCVDSLVVALLQSDGVYETIHMDKVSSTHFANSIIDGSKNSSYSSMMNEIAGVIETMTQSTEGSLEKDNVESVIASLTPETAAALGHLVSGSLVSNMGFGGNTASGVSQILTSVFENIADAKKNNTMDDATYAEESKKIAEIVDVTMNISKNKSDSVDVNSYVDNVMSSEIVTKSLCESVYGDGDSVTVDPLNTGINLSEANKDTLITNLQNRIDTADASDKEDTKKNAIAVAAYMNVDIEIVGDQIVVRDINSN